VWVESTQSFWFAALYKKKTKGKKESPTYTEEDLKIDEIAQLKPRLDEYLKSQKDQIRHPLPNRPEILKHLTLKEKVYTVSASVDYISETPAKLQHFTFHS